MGMTNDNTCEPKSISKEEIVDTLKTMVFGVQAFERFNAKERETLDKAWNIIDQYENRLKADMAAMLEGLQQEIEECVDGAEGSPQFEQGVSIARVQVVEIIQQKINELPPITPQKPRKGHWINKQRLFINSCSAECSSCHKRSNGYVHDNGFSLVCTYYDFCPNCGSDNREEEK